MTGFSLVFFGNLLTCLLSLVTFCGNVENSLCLVLLVYLRANPGSLSSTQLLDVILGLPGSIFVRLHGESPLEPCKDDLDGLTD